MLLDLYQAEYIHQEYERQVSALMLERAVRKARTERTRAMAHLAEQCVRLLVDLVSVRLYPSKPQPQIVEHGQ
jgi:hypothetical protein